MMGASRIIENEQGIVLVAGLMFLALLAVLASTAYLLSTTDMDISASYKHKEFAFNDAEAGLEWAKYAVESMLSSGAYMPENVGDTSAITGDAAPGTFQFKLSDMEKVGHNLYKVTSTGKGLSGATAKVSGTFRRKSTFHYAVFGVDQVDLKSSTGVFSYNSGNDGKPDPEWGNPSPADSDGVWDTEISADDFSYSTSNAAVGTNGDGDGKNDLILHSNSHIDGNVDLGGTDTIPAGKPAINDTGGTIEGETNNIGPIDPDPEDIGTDPEWLNKFPSYDPGQGGSNNNAAIAGLGDYVIDGSDGDVVIDQPGDYFFTDITLANGQTLSIDTVAAGGDINIWVVGKVEGKNDSEFDIRSIPSGHNFALNVTEPVGRCGCDTIIDLKNNGDFAPGSNPHDVQIRTDSEETVSIHNGNITNAVIYAPFAGVEFKNGAALFGSVWGRTVTLRNSMKVYYDELLDEGSPSNNIQYTSWKQELE